MAKKSFKNITPEPPEHPALAYISKPENTRQDGHIIKNSHENMIAINSLIPYKNHPFKLYEGDRLSDMVRSIKEMGILLPIIVRPILNDNSISQYEILSGHN